MHLHRQLLIKLYKTGNKPSRIYQLNNDFRRVPNRMKHSRTMIRNQHFYPPKTTTQFLVGHFMRIDNFKSVPRKMIDDGLPVRKPSSCRGSPPCCSMKSEPAKIDFTNLALTERGYSSRKRSQQGADDGPGEIIEKLGGFQDVKLLNTDCIRVHDVYSVAHFFKIFLAIPCIVLLKYENRRGPRGLMVAKRHQPLEPVIAIRTSCHKSRRNKSRLFEHQSRLTGSVGAKALTDCLNCLPRKEVSRDSQKIAPAHPDPLQFLRLIVGLYTTARRADAN